MKISIWFLLAIIGNFALLICSDALDLKLKGDAFFDRGDYDSAISCYLKVININPDVAIVYGRLGLAYAGKGDYGSAIKNYKKAISLEPKKSAGYYYNLGDAYNLQSNYNDAIRSYNKTIELDTKQAFAYDGIGRAYFAMNDFNNAIKYYQKAINTISKPNSGFYFNLGIAYASKGDNSTAIKYYEKAISINPKLSEVYDGLARSYAFLGKNEMSLDCIKKAAQLGHQGAKMFCKDNNINF